MHTPRDVSVCFPGQPCHDFVPLQGYVVNLTSALTPATPAILVGCVIVLVAGMVLFVLGLRPRRGHRWPSPVLVLLSTALLVFGWAVSGIVDTRFFTMNLVYGIDGGPSIDLVGSWPEIRLVSDGIAVFGFVALVLTATIATGRRYAPLA